MIYFIQAGKNGPIKIGQSDDPKERLNQLQTANPYELKILWLFDYDGGDWDEQAIHKEFRHELIRGEWFRPSRKLFKFIKEELYNVHVVYCENKRVFYEIYERFPSCIDILGEGFCLSQEDGTTFVRQDGPKKIEVV